MSCILLIESIVFVPILMATQYMDTPDQLSTNMCSMTSEHPIPLFSKTGLFKCSKLITSKSVSELPKNRFPHGEWYF